MPRDRLLLGEMIEAGERIVARPEVGWADPVRLRNRIVHGYWAIDLDVLVSTARYDVPGLVAALRVIKGEI